MSTRQPLYFLFVSYVLSNELGETYSGKLELSGHFHSSRLGFFLLYKIPDWRCILTTLYSFLQ